MTSHVRERTAQPLARSYHLILWVIHLSAEGKLKMHVILITKKISLKIKFFFLTYKKKCTKIDVDQKPLFE